MKTTSWFLSLFSLLVAVPRTESLATGSNKASRRSFLENSGASLCITFLPTSCLADEASQGNVGGGPNKPFAPLEALLPATRLKRWIDQAQDVASTLIITPTTTHNDKDRQYKALIELDQILSNRPKLFRNEKSVQKTSSNAQLTGSVSGSIKEQYQTSRKDLSVPDKVAAMFNQADVERQWGMLQYSESQREKQNEMRAAMNFYTQQLQFGDRYLLTASKEDRKRLIRNDQLPSLKAVITSDLDLRDLYRNQFLTAIEDAQAEVAYQVKEPQEMEISDVIDLMNQATTAFIKWFVLIDPQDAEEALQVVKNE